MVSGGVVGPPPRQPSDGSDGWWGGGSRARSRFRTAAQQRARVRPPRTDEQLRNSFNFKLYAIKLASACRMYGVVMPAEGLGCTVRTTRCGTQRRRGGSTLPCAALWTADM